jgi:hypothetical protein
VSFVFDVCRFGCIFAFKLKSDLCRSGLGMSFVFHSWLKRVVSMDGEGFREVVCV